MDRLFKLEPGQPAAMQLGPGWPPIVASLTQQEPGELLTSPAQAVHRAEPGPYQIAHRLVSDIRNPYRGQFAGPVQLGRAGGIAPIGLDPVARPALKSARGDHDAFMPPGRQSTLNAITARPHLVAKPQRHAVAAELAQQTVQRRRRVRDPAVLPYLAARATTMLSL